MSRDNLIMHYLCTANNDLTEIVLTFSVRGDSFLLADRIFGRVERRLKQKPIVVLPKSFHNTKLL